ncbi:MAG: GTPase ObgE [Candidatus Omnitrophota bacterium]|jgi:GTP-binding protein
MFIDEAKIYVKAGDGAKGCQSIYRDRVNWVGKPDGGPGGAGGDIIFEVDLNIHTLLDFQYNQHVKGDSGVMGGSNHKKGARGKDSHVKVPPGTLIKDARTGLVLRDLVKVGDRVIAAKGGAGGKGNSKGHDSTPGMPGEEKTLLLELKLIADACIIGYPNAGKSTLISKLSSARPKIANYPFTTREPVLGVVKIHEDRAIVLADIPGLIEGAHSGRGLGDKFLRHIERTKVLVHLVDISGFEGRDPYEDYLSLNKELKLYSKELAKRPQVIGLNKSDMEGAEENARKFKKHIRGRKVFLISALTGKGLKELLAEVDKTVRRSDKG